MLISGHSICELEVRITGQVVLHYRVLIRAILIVAQSNLGVVWRVIDDQSCWMTDGCRYQHREFQTGRLTSIVAEAYNALPRLIDDSIAEHSHN